MPSLTREGFAMKDQEAIRVHADHTPAIRFKKILAPTDFSACANHAFAHALNLARRYGAEVHVLHVIEPLEGDVYSPLRYSPEASARQETPDKIVYDLLQEVIAGQETEGLTVEPVKRHGRAVVPTLLQYAKAEDIDLVVMGTHGRHGMQRVFMGSAAERTVRLAPCSVLTVHEPPDATSGDGDFFPLQIQRILVPLDFSEHSEALLRAAHKMAGAYGAQLDLLHVIEPVPFLGLLTGALTTNDLVPDLGKRAIESLRQLWGQVATGEVPAKPHVEEGHAAAHIVDFAARCGTDLIVIGAQGRSALERFLIGSVAERVVRTAPCPVLIHKPLPADGAAQHTLATEEPTAQPRLA